MKKRVTAYCRVSTDKDDQLNSLENQERYFKEYIGANPDWEYVPLYVDEGISGTSTRKRMAFNKMIVDAKAGMFDMILTKDVSRFARNLEDTLRYVRELRDIKVGIYFIANNIDTLDRSQSFLLGFLGGIAENESERISQRVKWGQRRSMERGVVFGNRCLGYMVKNGKLEVDPKNAAVVKGIFNAYLHEGKGLAAIGKELEEQGAVTSAGGKRWDATTVKRILTNEKYCGDLKQMKTYTEDFLTQKSKINKGEVDFVMIENNHDAIIDRDTFDKVQLQIRSRGLKEGVRYSNRYAFSGRLSCGHCGASLISRTRLSKDKSRNIHRWQCSQYYKYGPKHKDERGCESEMIRNEILERVFCFALSDIAQDKEAIVDECVELVIGTLGLDSAKDDHAETQKEINGINKQLGRVISLCIKGLISEEELEEQRKTLDRQKSAFGDKLLLLSKNMSMTSEREVLRDRIKERIGEIVCAETFSEDVVKEMLDKIVVYGKDCFEVHVKGCV
ncbi:MAG: recombinase family protein [Defluviitaleaceae bacterium]|nr:recombinase family protein [Defluviitaleaceae bacterium]